MKKMMMLAATVLVSGCNPVSNAGDDLPEGVVQVTYQVNTDDEGNASFDVSVDPTTEAEAPFISAIATDAAGNSSEVSNCITPMGNITFRDNFEGQCLDRFAASGGVRSQIWYAVLQLKRALAYAKFATRFGGD